MIQRHHLFDGGGGGGGCGDNDLGGSLMVGGGLW